MAPEPTEPEPAESQKVVFEAVHPVIDVRDVLASVEWYGANLGFEPLFINDDQNPNYAGLRRGAVELHMQWHSAQEWETMSGSVYRFLVDDPDALHIDYEAAGVLPRGKKVEDTDWGTREFGLYDPDGNALFFYRDR